MRYVKVRGTRVQIPAPPPIKKPPKNRWLFNWRPKPVEGLSGRAAGFTEVIKNAGFKADFVTVAGLSETAMRGVKNAEAQLELANGRKVVYDSLFCMDCDDTDPVKGTMSAEFGHLGAAREA